ncbi:MAG: small multi-drug export protein [Bacillota bacterium]|nr:small multi-drug export protein [Bacillota bacterium]
MTDYLISQFQTMSEGMKYLMTFLISMLPIVELRGAVPIGVALGLNTYLVLLISIIGNMVPIPFVIIFARAIINWLKKKKFLAWFGRWLEKKAAKNVEKVIKYEKIGLFIFVAIPLPGTGAWTGALIASLFDLRLKNSILPIAWGVALAGVIMTLGSEGIKLLIT